MWAAVTVGMMLATLTAGPAAAADRFTDDDTSVHETNIELIAEAGITQGCAPTRFCPDGTVTRSQMSAFLSRAFDLPTPTGDWFTDDRGSVFEADHNRLAASGITQGCGGTRFCGGQAVTRGQMAAFLNRAIVLGFAPAQSAQRNSFRPPFSDINRSPFKQDIIEVWRFYISNGCNPPTNDLYCPNDYVTRAEMATFLTRLLDLDV